MTTRPDGYLLTAEAAAILHVSPKTMSRWAKDGWLPPETFRHTLGGHRRYSEQAIRDLAKTLTENQEP